jgi:hypothetical protein
MDLKREVSDRLFSDSIVLGIGYEAEELEEDDYSASSLNPACRNKYVRITLALKNRDGKQIRLYVRRHKIGQYSVQDEGETLAWFPFSIDKKALLRVLPEGMIMNGIRLEIPANSWELIEKMNDLLRVIISLNTLADDRWQAIRRVPEVRCIKRGKLWASADEAKNAGKTPAAFFSTHVRTVKHPVHGTFELALIEGDNTPIIIHVGGRAFTMSRDVQLWSDLVDIALEQGLCNPAITPDDIIF